MKQDSYKDDLKDKKILFIEDDKFLATLFSDYFRKHNLSVEWARDGNEGLKKAQEIKPVLILLDLILPGMDGYEVLKQLKKNPELKNIPVIILSNLGQADEIKRGLDLGAESFLVKAQFDINEIMNKIKERLIK